MEIISGRTVVLTPAEMEIKKAFHRHMEAGESAVGASLLVQAEWPSVEDAFIRWLRGESLTGPPAAKRDEWHTETWAEALNCLREHMSELGFETQNFPDMRTLAISAGEKTLLISDTTGRVLPVV